MIKLNVFDSNKEEHVNLAKEMTNVLFVHPETNALTFGYLEYKDYGIDHVDVIVENKIDDIHHYNYKQQCHNMFGLLFCVVETDE